MTTKDHQTQTNVSMTKYSNNVFFSKDLCQLGVQASSHEKTPRRRVPKGTPLHSVPGEFTIAFLMHVTHVVGNARDDGQPTALLDTIDNVANKKRHLFSLLVS